MAKKKTLPTFDVVGTLEELLPVEMLLVMSGYDKPKEEWNNKECSEYKESVNHLTAWDIDEDVAYYTDGLGFGNYKILPASDLNAIAQYIEDYGK